LTRCGQQLSAKFVDELSRDFGETEIAESWDEVDSELVRVELDGGGADLTGTEFLKAAGKSGERLAGLTRQRIKTLSMRVRFLERGSVVPGLVGSLPKATVRRVGVGEINRPSPPTLPLALPYVAAPSHVTDPIEVGRRVGCE
jgi:hypothetical protein